MSELLDKWAAAGHTAPIIYMPLKDAATAHENLGTGGSFVQNGLLATADVGANQLTCRASSFDGVNDSLVNSSFGETPSKTLTLVFNCTHLNDTAGAIFSIDDGGALNVQSLQMYLRQSGLGYSSLHLDNSALTEIGNIDFNFTQRVGVKFQLAISLDMNSGVVATLNGDIITTTLNTFTNDLIDFSNLYASIATRFNGATFYNANIGELYFDTNYIDLATNNPFWDRNKQTYTSKNSYG
jgi:hypothetical protein